MKLFALSVCGLLTAALAGSGAWGDSGRPVTVSIQLTAYVPGSEPRQVQSTASYSLTCNPAGGTLPLADRVCADIALHPQAMLAPRRLGVLCDGSTAGPLAVVQVTAESGGSETRLSADGEICDPADVAGDVYLAAARQDVGELGLLELLLPCDETPSLFVKPPPNLSIFYCMHGLWTPREQQLLRTAEQVPAIAALRPTKLFPADIGARPCPLRQGVLGTCAVYLLKGASKQIVTFAESWPVDGGKKKDKQVWHVAIVGGAATLTDYTGHNQPET